MDDDTRTTIGRVAGALFEQQRLIANVPRMAAGVVVGGELVAFAGHGTHPDSLFRIASMTKSFTAAAILILRDDGKLGLDAPVATWAPEFASLAGPTGDSPAVTIRQLLTMSGGLATDDPWADRHLDIAAADLDAVVTGDPLFAQVPGTRFEYSNLGYAVLGRVIERVAGQRAQDFVSDRLLRPLGMSRTVWEAADAPAGSDIVVGLRGDGVTPELTPLDGGLAPMGGLWSSVGDLARWIGFFTDAYPARDDPDSGPLRRASRREMQQMATFQPPATTRARDGATWRVAGGYGMGLSIAQDGRLGEVAGHSGGLPGYGSNMRWIRGGTLGVVALGNLTYAPMAHATQRALDALAAAGVARKPRVEPSFVLTAAGTALFGLLTNWSEDRAAALFADNVAPDDGLAARKASATAFVARHGPLRFARIDADSRASGRLVVQSATRELAIAFSLAPLRGAWIQRYDLPGA